MKRILASLALLGLGISIPGHAQAAPNATTPCGVTATAIPHYDHIIWLVFENKSFGSVIGSSNAPYLTSLAHKCGTAKGMVAETHPSLPNYIWMTAGSQKGVTDDGPPSQHHLTGTNIFRVIPDWRALEESMPSNCYKSNSGGYAVRHNPAAYFTDLPSCATRDVPLSGTPNLSARFTMIEPNLCHSMHDCSVATGDAWAAGFVPKLLNSPQYAAGKTAIFITFDEDDRTAGNHIPTIVISPSVKPGVVVATTYNHCSMQHTTIKKLQSPGPYTFAGCGSTASMSGFNL
jgi:phosphatidylinositol-3-phosphatase